LALLTLHSSGEMLLLYCGTIGLSLVPREFARAREKTPARRARSTRAVASLRMNFPCFCHFVAQTRHPNVPVAHLIGSFEEYEYGEASSDCGRRG
jgi:hypothetical protein